MIGTNRVVRVLLRCGIHARCVHLGWVAHLSQDSCPRNLRGIKSHTEHGCSLGDLLSEEVLAEFVLALLHGSGWHLGDSVGLLDRFRVQLNSGSVEFVNVHRNIAVNDSCCVLRFQLRVCRVLNLLLRLLPVRVALGGLNEHLPGSNDDWRNLIRDTEHTEDVLNVPGHKRLGHIPDGVRPGGCLASSAGVNHPSLLSLHRDIIIQRNHVRVRTGRRRG